MSNILTHEHYLRLQSLADDICCAVNNGDTPAMIALNVEDMRAIIWASLLLRGDNVKFQVVPK